MTLCCCSSLQVIYNNAISQSHLAYMSECTCMYMHVCVCMHMFISACLHMYMYIAIHYVHRLVGTAWHGIYALLYPHLPPYNTEIRKS